MPALVNINLVLHRPEVLYQTEPEFVRAYSVLRKPLRIGPRFRTYLDKKRQASIKFDGFVTSSLKSKKIEIALFNGAVSTTDRKEVYLVPFIVLQNVSDHLGLIHSENRNISKRNTTFATATSDIIIIKKAKPLVTLANIIKLSQSDFAWIKYTQIN